MCCDEHGRGQATSAAVLTARLRVSLSRWRYYREGASCERESQVVRLGRGRFGESIEARMGVAGCGIEEIDEDEDGTGKDIM